MQDIDDDSTFVVDNAIINKLGSKEEIDLYNEILLALELMDNSNFKILNSNIKNGINFNILTQYPDDLPEKVGILFFNIDTKFDVICKETSYPDGEYKNFNIKIKKY